MGAGIALSIAKTYPSATLADLRTVKGDKKKLGTYTRTMIERTLPRDLPPISAGMIFNLYTQYGFSDGATDVFEYDDFQAGLRRIFDQYVGHFGLPMIGSGLACGVWSEIEDIIIKAAKINGTQVTIYQL
jgi:O-acetyl-ADP-ribose deacetylase (regulator of RNase III)